VLGPVEIPEERPLRQPRRIGYFSLHPEYRFAQLPVVPDEDPCDHVIRGLAESDGEAAHRNDVTEDVYSSDTTTIPPLLSAREINCPGGPSRPDS
jgi:hypothetical protein